MDNQNRELSQIWAVPNQNAFGKMNAIFHGITDILSFPSKNDLNGTAGNAGSQTNNVDNVKMVLLKKNSWVFGRFKRKLVNETLGVFSSLQKHKNSADSDSKSFLIKKSKEYRSVIQACLSDMNQYIEAVERGRTPPFQEDVAAVKVDCQLLYKMELILGLVELVFIEAQPGSSVVGSLLNWVRLHFPECRRRLAEALALDQPANYEHYWDTVFGLVLQGLVVEARDLLQRHPDSNTDGFLSLDEMLRKMPRYYAYSGISEPEFGVRWQHWKSEIQSRLEAGDFIHAHQLQTIAKVMSGDVETMVSLADLLDTWYCLMASTLFYTNPMAKVHRLPSAASEAVSAFGMVSSLSHLDELLLAVFQMDDHQVLKECQTVLNNLWFCCHLSDLFYHARFKTSNKYLADIRESLLSDYGWELVSHPSLWQVGLIYLDALGPPTAGPSVQAALECIPISSDQKALKLTREASIRGMDFVAMGICRVMGRRKFQQGQLGSAIWWGIRSQDSAFSSFLAHQVLQKYMEDGEFVSSSLLDHLGPSMQLSDALTFLGKYREFHVLYQEGKIQEAAQLLVSLIASRLAPEYFWPVLLEDALPLLQSPDAVITADQTYKLMYCLHSISVNHGDSESSLTRKKKLYSSFLDKEASVRLALTNNLARATIQEGTVS